MGMTIAVLGIWLSRFWHSRTLTWPNGLGVGVGPLLLFTLNRHRLVSDWLEFT